MSVLSGGVERAVEPLIGFSCDKRLSALQAKGFYEDGFRFCLRDFYSKPNKIKKNLDQEEMVNILDSGLAIMPVYHINNQNWQPSAELARFHGEQVTKDAKALGMPAGLNVWCYITGLANDVSIQDVIIYCNHWYDAVMEHGYVPALFVNSCLPLSGNQLFCYLNFKHFCRHYEQAPHIPEVGYEMFLSSAIKENVNKVETYRLQLNQQGKSSSWLKKIQ